MFRALRREFTTVNMLLIFLLVCTVMLSFYFVNRIRTELSISESISFYMSRPIDDIRNSAENPRLFISEIDVGTYNYVRRVVDSNIFKYFRTLYANDSFSSHQTNDILSHVVSDPDDVSTIVVDGRQYRYVRQSIGNMMRIAVLDITSSMESVRSAEVVLLMIGVASLIPVFFISRFITNRSVRPIETMYDRQMSFFSDIAHELRTPLTVAITNLAVLESHRAESVESQQKWIDFMKFQLNRLTRLVNDMLFLESVDAWDPYEGLEQVDLSSLVDRCVKSMGALIEEKRITLITNIQEAVFMNAHGELMTRLISVLVDNAIKYTPEGGVISVSLSQSVAATVLTVENTGEGIEPENLNRVFDRLFRVSKSRSRDEGGSGLGLAIAKSVVEKYGGSISVDSKVGEKTTFQVRIPR